MKKTSTANSKGKNSRSSCIYQITRQKPGFFNDGDGYVNIECLTDEAKSRRIIQSNCLISNQQVVKIYEYLQQNPDITYTVVTSKKLASYRVGPDKGLNVRFWKNDKSVDITMSDLPDAKNVALMRALTADASKAVDRNCGRR